MDALASEVQVPNLQSDHETPITALPSPQVDLLTPWNEAAPRIRSVALSHYVHALVVTIEDFFIEHRPAAGHGSLPGRGNAARWRKHRPGRTCGRTH